MDIQRKIIHIDMDAFFAAVEQRDFPQYLNKPLIVGGPPDSRGVVATCNYQARKFGIHSAMPSAQAYRLCPQAIFVKPRFQAYKEVSAQIRQIFGNYTERFEPLSLDEAYLDVTGLEILQGSATRIAEQIKREIMQKTRLTASAGVSYNKFLAKMASDINKPDGLYLITPDQGARFVETLPVQKFHGIGKATAGKMNALGIENGKDLKQCTLAFLQQHFGKSAQHYYNISRGIDHRPVNNHRISKSVGVETTYQHDLNDSQTINQQLHLLLQQALTKLAEKKMAAHTLTVKIKYHDFVQITRSKTLAETIQDSAGTYLIIDELLKNTEIGQRKVRLLGITLSSLQSPSEQAQFKQLDLFRQFR